MIKEKGILPVGIEKDGKYHREFEIRPALVKDSVEVADEQEPKKLENPTFYGLCLAAKQIVRIGDIAPVSVDILTGMLHADFSEISQAKEMLDVRLGSFHNPPAKAAEEIAGATAPGDKGDRDSDLGAAQNTAVDG